MFDPTSFSTKECAKCALSNMLLEINYTLLDLCEFCLNASFTMLYYLFNRA